MPSDNGKYGRGAMPCTVCGFDTEVYWTGLLDGLIFRRRRCLDTSCGRKFQTREEVSKDPLWNKEETCSRGHVWTPFTRRIRSDGYPECRTCTNERARGRTPIA